MLIKIAWRNIWRNSLRSGVVIASISLGLWAGLFMIALTNGLNKQRLINRLDNSIGHLKIINPKFGDEKLLKYHLPKPRDIVKRLEKEDQIIGISPRVNITGMANTASGSFGVDIYGIDPTKEQKVFGIHKGIVDGRYFGGRKHNPIIVGQKLAERLSLEPGSEITLNFINIREDIIPANFKVVGIYHVSNSIFEGSHVFVRARDIRILLGSDKNLTHQIMIKTNDYRKVIGLKKELQAEYPQLDVQSWLDMSPEMAYLDEVMHYFFLIFIGIILLALSMGIINTMLMAVLERTRELGVLMAIGMNRNRIFGMIMIETFFLTCAGLPIGLLLSWLSIYWTNRVGIDLSTTAKGFEAMGYDNLIRPSLGIGEYQTVCFMVFVTTLFSVLYPAWRALKLNPSECIRKI